MEKMKDYEEIEEKEKRSMPNLAPKNSPKRMVQPTKRKKTIPKPKR